MHASSIQLIRLTAAPLKEVWNPVPAKPYIAWYRAILRARRCALERYTCSKPSLHCGRLL